MRQPVRRLTDFLSDRYVHVSIEAPDEVDAQLRRVIEHSKSDTLAAGNFRIARENFALPLRLEKIPVGANFARLHGLGMIRDILTDVAHIDKDILALGVDIMMLTEPPLGLVDHFRKDQRRADAVQDFRAVKNFIRCSRPRNIDIDEILSRAPLRHDARRQRIAPPGGGHQFDLRIFFLKSLCDRAQLAVAFKKIQRQRAFFLRGLNGPLPFDLPACLGFGRLTR